MEKPVFVFVPGAWHTAETFNRLRHLMAAQGLDSVAITTPSVGASPPVKGLHADIIHTRAVLQELVDNGRQVVVVMHSYGGAVGGSAIAGLGYAQRAKAGRRGGIIMAVWMAAFVVPKETTVLDLLGGNWEPWMKFKNDDGYVHTSDESNVFYGDVTPEEQQKQIAMLKPQPQLSFKEPALYEPWLEIPSMYLFCEKDQALPLVAQEAFAKILGQGPSMTYRTDTSHSPFLSQPDKVIEGLRLALQVGREHSGIRALAAL
ncbi:Alpha/beta hydrolase fold-1 [Aspergillus venezuelensis]